MLVMKLTVMFFVMTLLVGSLGALAGEPAPGAGPIVFRMSPCRIANRGGPGAPCPEPAVSDSGDNQVVAASHLRRAVFFIDVQEIKKATSEIDAALDLR